MIKKIKLGLSAVAVFALMFAASVSVVAQEKVNASNNHVEAKELVAANKLISAETAAILSKTKVGVLGMPARATKEPISALVKSDKKSALVTYGIIDYIPATGGNPAKLMLTQNPIGQFDGSCGTAAYPCRITFNEGAVDIIPDGSGGHYVEEGDDYTPSTSGGPYSGEQ